jgi:hypothetical protein
MKKLILESGSSQRGAQVGRPDVLPTNLNDPIKLRVEKLRWVDGDYDRFGAYWGGGNGTDIYCAWGEEGDHQVLVFVRAATRVGAKHLVLQKLPKASFYDGPPPKLTSLKPGGRALGFRSTFTRRLRSPPASALLYRSARRGSASNTQELPPTAGPVTATTLTCRATSSTPPRI